MNKRSKIWLIAGAFLIVIGAIAFAAAMSACGWNFTKPNTKQYETVTYAVKENFSDISIDADSADIFFVPSEDGECKVICDEEATTKHSVAVMDGKLCIADVYTGKWYEHIRNAFENPKITVCLPQEEYGALSITADTGDLKIPECFKFEGITISASTGDITSFASAYGPISVNCSTGDIRIEGVSAGALELSVSTGTITVSDTTCSGDISVYVSSGRVSISDAECQNIISGGNTGDITLTNVIAAELFSVKRSTGDVTLDGCDAAEVFITTDTGDVMGSFVTDKVFITQTNTGDVDVPHTTTGGKCEIRTDTGDIKIKIG